MRARGWATMVMGWCRGALVGMIAAQSLLGVARAAEVPPSPATKVANPPSASQLAERDRLFAEAQRLRNEGKPAEALAVAERMLAVERDLFPADSEELPGSFDWLAATAEQAELWQAAESYRNQSLSWLKQHRAPMPWRASDALLALQHTKLLKSLSPESRSRLNRAAQLDGEVFRLYGTRDYAAAAQRAEQSCEIRKEVLGDKHEHYAVSLINLATLRQNLGDFARAERLYGEVRDIQKQVLGEHHPNYALTLNTLAMLYDKQRDYAHAEPLFVETLAIRKKTLGENHPDYALSLNNLAALYQNRGDYTRAEPLYAEALSIRKKILGVKHPDYALSLNNLANLYQNQGKHARAEPLYVEAAGIRKEVLGETHPDYALSLNNLATLYDTMADYARAEPLYIEALAIRKKILGAKHSDYALSLSNLANLYLTKHDYARAEPLLVEAHAIRKDLLGERHPDYALSLNGLGVFYTHKGDYPRAEPYFVEALAIRKCTLGEKHPDYAASVSNLAVLYLNLGDFARAEPLYLEALAIRREVLGEKHPDYAASLGILGHFYHTIGDYARAEPLYIKARAIRREVLGEKHPAYAQNLNNLANLYENIGDFARAEPLYLEALAIKKEVLGDEHPDYALGRNNLAALYANRSEFARAEPLLVENRALYRKVLGDKHPTYATATFNLAAIYEALGDYARAEPLYREALAIRKQALGTQHPEYAASLNNLAILYQRLGDFERSEPLLVEARAVSKQALGDKHPWYGASVSNLALLYARLGRTEEADALYREALDLSRRSLEATSIVQSERQQLAMGRNVRHHLDRYVTLGLGDDRFARNVFGQVLAWKGATLVRQRGMRLAGTDPAAAELVADLRRTAGQLATLSRAVPAEATQQAAWRSRLADLTQEKERLEADLGRRSAPYRQATDEVTLDDLLAALPDDGVLVDYLEFSCDIPAEKKGAPAISQRQLVAFVVRRAERSKNQVTMIGLGPVEPLGTAIDVWRQSFGSNPQGVAAGRTLRAALWEPLLAHLAEAKTILVSTDGALGRLPLGALPGREPGSYLLEDHRLALLPVPQLLPRLLLAESNPAVRPSLLVVGDVNFDAPSPAVSPPSAQSPVLLAAAERGAVRGGSVTFAPLPGAAREAQAVKTLFTATFPEGTSQLLRQDEAGEAELRTAAPAYRYLHLATHGYFAPPQVPSAMAAIQQPQGIAAQADLEREIAGYHPGLLSGLAMAGANRPPESGRDDGILTALEAAELDLDGVELVTLSACETGLGATAGGEGVLGLQRAFQVAGAKNVVSSLWKVDDEATAALMTLFYENLWQKKLPPVEALRQAQLTILNAPEQIATYATRGVGEAKPLPDAGKPATPPTTSQRTDIRRWAAFQISGAGR